MRSDENPSLLFKIVFDLSISQSYSAPILTAELQDMTAGVEIPGYLKSGELARLLPVLADSKKEERITSSVLSALMAVPPLANSLFASVEAPVRKKSQIVCYTEVVFDEPDTARSPRPDGLIVLKSGKTTWSALVEAKIGNSVLQREQVEEYIRLAKKFGIDAVITFSNQFASLPTHHPLEIPASKLRSVGLYHLSWMGLLSKAQVLSESGDLVDPEQAFIVRELIRYLKHDASGVVSFSSMGKQWKDVCARVLSGATFKKNDKDLETTVSNWHELIRYLSLELTASIGRPVDVVLSKQHAKEPRARLENDIVKLAQDHKLDADLRVPDAAAPITFTADFLRRTINFSMKLVAPQDKSKATACVNHYTRQLKDHPKPDEIIVRAHWPGRTPHTDASLADALSDPKALVPDALKLIPKHLEFVCVNDLASKFPGSRAFVEVTNETLKVFYEHVGQNLKVWSPSAPRVLKESQTVPGEGNDDSSSGSAQVDSEMPNDGEPQVEKKKDPYDIPAFLIRNKTMSLT